MKVVLLSTYEQQGGAAIACKRLAEALKTAGADVKTVVQVKSGTDPNVISVSSTTLGKVYSFIRFSWERLIFAMKERSKEVRFAFSIANTGVDISELKEVKEADIIHLHWINQGFLSLDSIKKLVALNKPLVWTLHDMWAFTGGCHYSGTCRAYETECRFCPYLKNPSEDDLSNKVWNRKQAIFKNASITFVTCSQWLQNIAQTSRLINTFSIQNIPNPIDTHIFFPGDKTVSRKKLNIDPGKKIILFGAMNSKDKRKGFAYLIKSLQLLSEKFPETLKDLEVAVFGKANPGSFEEIPYKVHYLGSLTSLDQIITSYSAADAFLLPSLEDNLPNTIMEAMACGIPVAAFDTGGIPEMIDHRENGYLAKYQSSEDLATGIRYLLYNDLYSELSAQSRKKVVSYYEQSLVAKKYMNLYRTLLKK